MDPLEVGVGPFAVAPVVPECLALGVEDRAMVALDDGADLDAGRQRRVRDGVSDAARHLEEPANWPVAVAFEQRPGAVLAVEELACQALLHLGRVPGSDLAQPRLRRAKESPADAAPPDQRMDRSTRAIDVSAVAHRPAHPRERDDLAVTLDDRHVAWRILVDEMLELGPQLVERLDDVDAVGLVS